MMKGKKILLTLMIFLTACNANNETSNKSEKNPKTDIDMKEETSNKDALESAQTDQAQMDELIAQNQAEVDKMMEGMSEEEKKEFEKNMAEMGFDVNDVSNMDKLLEKSKDQNLGDMSLAGIQKGDGERKKENTAKADTLYAKIKEVKTDISLEGIEGEAPTSKDDLMTTFGFTEDQSGEETYFEDISYMQSKDGKEYKIASSQSGSILTIEPKSSLDISLPYGISGDDSKEEAKEKLIEGAHLLRLNEDSHALDFAAGDKIFSLNFDTSTGKIYSVTIEEPVDSSTIKNDILLNIYIKRNRPKEEGSFMIEDQKLTYPMTMGDLKDALGGEYELISDENTKDFSKDFDMGILTYGTYAILDAPSHKYLVEYNIPDSIKPNLNDQGLYTPDDSYEISGISFYDGPDFAIEGKDIDINQESYKDLEKTLLDKGILYSKGIDGLEYTPYDNIKFISKGDLVTIKVSNYEQRLYEDAQKEVMADQAY